MEKEITHGIVYGKNKVNHFCQLSSEVQRCLMEWPRSQLITLPRPSCRSTAACLQQLRLPLFAHWRLIYDLFWHNRNPRCGAGQIVALGMFRHKSSAALAEVSDCLASCTMRCCFSRKCADDTSCHGLCQFYSIPIPWHTTLFIYPGCDFKQFLNFTHLSLVLSAFCSLSCFFFYFKVIWA